MMKQLKVFLALCLLTSLCGCAQTGSQDKEDDQRLHIIATVFPLYDWCREVLGDHIDEVNLTFLMNRGNDLHSFQPAAADMMAIAECDVFLYVGGESDEWVSDALKQSSNKDQTALKIMDVLKDQIREEEIKEGMEAEEEEEVAYDEHVWLSLRNAELAVEVIAEVLAEKDSANQEDYLANAKAYITKLSELDDRYQQTVRDGEFSTLLFADRFPFRYMIEDYDLDYYAAFAGCSAETEASFETVIFLANKCDELGLKHILCIEGGDEKIARTVINSTSSKAQDILHMDSMQGTDQNDVNNGVTYLSVMEKNLTVLQNALN